MKITGHRTRSVFECHTITDHSDTLEAGTKAGEFLAREHGKMPQFVTQENNKKK